MSLKEYNELNQDIADIYTYTCIPCMQSTGFLKGDCKRCSIMNKYIRLQAQKKEMENGKNKD